MLATTVARRIRSGVRKRVDRLIDRLGRGRDEAPPVAAAAPEPVVNAVDPAGSVEPAVNPEPAVSPEPAEPAITREQVEVLFEDMVRPALQSDGGDITLVKVEHNDVYVRLLGACETCPSSIMTMQMGIERLLQEEFPNFGRLIRVDDPAAAEWPAAREA